MSPQTVTGQRTGCTFHSSIRMALACSQSALISASGRYLQSRSCAICRSRSPCDGISSAARSPSAAEVGWVGATPSPAGGPAGGQVGARVWGRLATEEEAELMPPFFLVEGGGTLFCLLCECEIFPRLQTREHHFPGVQTAERAGRTGFVCGLVVLEGWNCNWHGSAGQD
jgi:hypothetical protein